MSAHLVPGAEHARPSAPYGLCGWRDDARHVHPEPDQRQRSGLCGSLLERPDRPGGRAEQSVGSDSGFSRSRIAAQRPSRVQIAMTPQMAAPPSGVALARNAAGTSDSPAYTSSPSIPYGATKSMSKSGSVRAPSTMYLNLQFPRPRI